MFLSLGFCLFSTSLYAQLYSETGFQTPQSESRSEEAIRLKYIAQIELNTAEELNQSLMRVADLVERGGWQAGRDEPVAFLLHGNEANALVNENYSHNQQLVELAKNLSDKRAVNIRVCRVWMLRNGIELTQLPAFVSPIVYAPAGKKLLELEGYVYF